MNRAHGTIHGFARLLAALALCGPLACGDDGSGQTETGETEASTGEPDDRQVFILSDGTEVLVADTGAIALRRDGREFFWTAGGAGPTTRTYTESHAGLAAIWQFSREGVVASEHTYSGVSQDDAGVHLEFTGDTGALVQTVRVGTPGEMTIVDHAPGAAGYDSLAVPLACDEQASFYGFGEQYNATDQRGEAFDLFVSEQGIGREPDKAKIDLNGDAHTTYFPMPYFLDARGFGVLADTPYRTLVDLCKTDADIAWIEATGGAPLSLQVFGGPTALDVIRQLGDAIGRPTEPPAWAYELWIGAQGGRDDVLAEADALEAAGIDAGVLWVQDWSGIRMNFDGGFGVEYRWLPDDELYPDLAGMIDTLHQRGYRFLSYANPFIDPQLEHFDEMEAQGLLITDPETGEAYRHLAPNGLSSHPDLTNPAAREYAKDFFRAMVADYGMDGWMADFGEWLPLDAVLADGSDPMAFHNLYPVEWHSLWREVMDEERPDGDFVVFGRSGYTGVHAVSQVHWIGDQEATWSPHDGLPTVVPAMLNLGLSGVPFVTHDIAGFSGGPSTKELFMRWTELGAFTPIMRTHEGNNKLENWSWEKDAETTAHFGRFARIHDALAPELRALASEAAQTGAPIVRHLMLAFPDDPGSRGISDQFLLGDALLVAPVTGEGQTSRSVYLPPGTWYHVWTGEPREGGATIEVDAPLGDPPVFSRDVDRPDLRAIE